MGIYQTRRANGQCVACGGEPLPGLTRCEPCRVHYNAVVRKRGKRWRNTEANRAYNRARKERDRARMLALKQGYVCQQCGEADPVCLDFHHRDPSQKLFDIAANKYRPTEQLLAEIAKCDVLCSNCHRKLHWGDDDS